MGLIDDVRQSAHQVAVRVARSERERNWTDAELVLAMAICVYSDPGRLGGTKLRADGSSRQDPVVTAAARAIGRPDGGVVMKVQNLRYIETKGRRGLKSTAKRDTWAVSTFATKHADLVAAALVVAEVLPGARAVVDALVPGRSAERVGALPMVGEPETEFYREEIARRGQGLFRSRVMSNYRHACAFCGLKSRLPDENSYLLIASHIRPWRDSDGHQRLDPANGFSLCAIHDRAFDWGFLTVDEGMRIVASDAARDHYEPEERIAAEVMSLHGRPVFGDGDDFIRPGAAYLEHHRTAVFDRRFR